MCLPSHGISTHLDTLQQLTRHPIFRRRPLPAALRARAWRLMSTTADRLYLAEDRTQVVAQERTQPLLHHDARQQYLLNHAIVESVTGSQHRRRR